jgi:hypothetical protein
MVAAPPPAAEEASELIMGYLVPTMMDASWLFRVRMRGADRVSAEASSCNACRRMPY